MRIVINVTKNVIPRIIFFSLFILILLVVIAYARGYRFDFQDGKVKSTGILSVNSAPNSAKIYINGQLKGVTDTNITLPYGNYTVEVKKDGFTDWKKDVSLKGEIVINLDAHLYSKNPSLTPLTTLGVIKAVQVGDTNKLVLISQSGDVEKDGIYLFALSNNPISIFPPLQAVLLKSYLPEGTDLSNAELEFSPNYRQMLLTVKTNETDEITYLLSLENENKELFDLTVSKNNVLELWDNERNKGIYKIIEALPKKLVPIATEAFEIISLSPNEKRLMYRAKADATLPLIINPPLIGANQTVEERSIKKGKIYIYDKKEDKNFLVPVEVNVDTSTEVTPTPVELIGEISATEITPTPSLPRVYSRGVTAAIQDVIKWYPTSDYITVREKNHIVVMQYDGGNKQTVYAGPFNSNFYMISPDWNLLVLINLNPQLNQFSDLYSVGIR
jgi:hypothetical protein